MRLIRGAPGSGKTALVFHEFTEALSRGGHNPRIIAPTATLVRHYQHQLARQSLVFDPSRVVSLMRFALDCAPDQKLVPAGLLRALVRDSLSRLNLPEFAGVASTAGMTDVILETITDFENACTTPEQLGRSRNLSAHGRAFQKIWKDTDAAVTARGFSTRAQVIRRATENHPAGAVWMDGFLKFSPLESGLLRAVAAHADLTLTLTDSPVTHDTHLLALELGATDRLLPGVSRRPRTIAVKAPSPQREADEIARRILELQGEGVAFPDIAIAVRDVNNWLPLLRITLDRFGIPTRFYFSEPVKNHPVAVFLSGLIACVLNDWDFESALTTLRAHPDWGHSAAFDRFDFHVREAMPGHGADALLALCEPGTPLHSRIADCLKVAKWREERARPSIWRQRFWQLAESLYRVRTIPAPADYASIATARSHAAALRAWSSALETATLFTDEAISLAQFHAAVSDALDAARMQVPDHRRNVVHVMSAFEARQWEVRTLFVCGMTARDYPRRKIQNLLFPERESADDGEESLFESLKTRASDNLILTVSQRDQGGQSVVASQHFPEAAAQAQSSSVVSEASPIARAEPGRINAPSLTSLADQTRTIALTSLEDLAKCRFRFFSGRTLLLKGVPDQPAARLCFRTAGLIIHGAMETWLEDRTLDFVEVFEKHFDEYCRDKHVPPGYSVEVERLQLRRIARKVNDSTRWPALSSETEADCSFELPGNVTVNCRVDRIDHLAGSDCVIVDYKSGKTANVEKLVENETSLQGPLYALAVREKKQLHAVAMVFHAIREDLVVGWGAIPGSPLELNAMPPDWIDNARDRVIARLESFLSGDVHAEPISPDDCKWCNFKNACRIEQRDQERVAGA